VLKGDPAQVFGRLVRFVARRPLPVLAVVGVLALAGAALALRLEPSAATDTLVNRSSSSFQDTERFKKQFGDEAVVILVKGNLEKTLLSGDLGRLLKFEGCLSGNVPNKGLAQLPPVCRDIARFHPARVVYGPGTFINTAAGQISDEFLRRRNAKALQARQAAQAAAKLSARRGDPKSEQRRLAQAAENAVMSQFTQETLQTALRYGLTGVPSIDSPDFISALVFDPSGKGLGIPKTKWAYLFPSRRSALVQVRLRPDLSNAQRRRAIQLFERAASTRDFALQQGGRYIVSGVPVVAERLADAVQRAIAVLLIAALLVMGATLALVFRTPRMRLLPLGLALAAAAMTFGGLSLAGGSLTMASIAVLPVLIGLAVDYAIQFQARYDEARERRRGEPPAEVATTAAVAGGPTIATAGLATAAGFLVLLLSPIPMVRSFGLMLVLGIVLALGCALTAGFAALVRFSARRERPADVPPALPRLRARLTRLPDSRAGAWLSERWATLREVAADRSWRALHYSLARPRKVLGIGLALAVVGWVADTQTTVVSDIQQLVPQNLGALRDARQLQDETGVSGEIDVTVRARDITDPKVVGWMTRFQGGVLQAHGYRPGKHCDQKKGAPELCPALSLPDLFASAGRIQGDQARRLLDAVPSYFSQGVVSADRRTANLAFGIRLMPLDRQKQVVDDIEHRIAPPPGVSASVVGLPVLAAQANASLSSPLRRMLTLLAALAAVFLVLLAIRRSRRAAAVPLIPIALATGWSGGVLFLLGLLPGPLAVNLNPMSVTLGALVIAISTEFSVLLSSRYREERAAGAGPARAIELTYATTGAAVLASGATAIAGFAALIVSDIRMLRDFGIVTVADLTVSLLGVMVVLPAALLWAEQHGSFSVHDLDPRPLLREAWAARPALALPRRRSRA
jgi:hydrophobe/amphiphile efflux-3 (HAE3) family protein